MISLSKGVEPEVLATNSAAWTAELLGCIQRGETPSDALLNRYNHPAIKDALLTETLKKCAYCESFFRHVTYGDIEHITPKKQAPNLRYAWTNLTIACDVCNTKKGTEEQVVDPYLVDPSTCFIFYGPMIISRPNNESARITEGVLELNRSELFERRSERIKYIRSLIDLANSKTGTLKDVLIQQAKEEIQTHCEYSAMGKAFLDSYLGLAA